MEAQVMEFERTLEREVDGKRADQRTCGKGKNAREKSPRKSNL